MVSKILISFTVLNFSLSGNTKPKSETPTKSKKVSFLAEEVSVSKFEYNDEDIDSVVNETTDDDEATDTNDNNLSQQNLEQSPQDPNVSQYTIN